MPLTGAGMRRHLHAGNVPPKASSASSPCSAAPSVPAARRCAAHDRAALLRRASARPAAYRRCGQPTLGALDAPRTMHAKALRPIATARTTAAAMLAGQPRTELDTAGAVPSSRCRIRLRARGRRTAAAASHSPPCDDARVSRRRVRRSRRHAALRRAAHAVRLARPDVRAVAASADWIAHCTLSPIARTAMAVARSADLRLASAIVRRTPGISCEAVPASMPSTSAGMRRHVHSGNHAAESFVSFIPLFDSEATLAKPFWPPCQLRLPPVIVPPTPARNCADNGAREGRRPQPARGSANSAPFRFVRTPAEAAHADASWGSRVNTLTPERRQMRTLDAYSGAPAPR